VKAINTGLFTREPGLEDLAGGEGSAAVGITYERGLSRIDDAPTPRLLEAISLGELLVCSAVGTDRRTLVNH
jgi:hypothetical protein